MDLEDRARVHAALGDRARLAMVDQLQLGDRTFQELALGAGLPGNAAAHHLDVLEAAGLIKRRVSEGDHRRRYISLRHDRLEGIGGRGHAMPGVVLFVCTHNSARSQFAAAMWTAQTGRTAESAGTEPAKRVHPGAIRAAARFGIDLASASPKGYEAVIHEPDLVISVCDRAREVGSPFHAPTLHWSIPDPISHPTTSAFRTAFGELASRIERLAGATDPSHDRSAEMKEIASDVDHR